MRRSTAQGHGCRNRSCRLMANCYWRVWTYGIAQCAVPIDLLFSHVAEPGYERSEAPLIRRALEIFDHGDLEDIHATIASARMMNMQQSSVAQAVCTCRRTTPDSDRKTRSSCQ